MLDLKKIVVILAISSPLSGGGFNLSLGARVKVGWSHVSVTSAVNQRYRASYLISNNKNHGLFNNVVPAANQIVGVLTQSANPMGVAHMLQLSRDWGAQRLNFFNNLVWPTDVYRAPAVLAGGGGFVAQHNAPVADVYAATLNNGGAAAVPLNEYVYVAENDISVDSLERSDVMPFFKSGVDVVLRGLFNADSGVFAGLEASWSWMGERSVAVEDLSYRVDEDKWNKKSYTTLAGNLVDFADSPIVFGYHVFANRLMRRVEYTIDIQDRQKFLGVLGFDCGNGFSFAALCGVKCVSATIVLDRGRVSFPYAHRSFALGYARADEGSVNAYSVALQSPLKFNAVVWPVVWRAEACYKAWGGKISLGLEYSFYEVSPVLGVNKDLVTKNPVQAPIFSNFSNPVGWHISRIPFLQSAFSYKMKVYDFALHVGFMFVV
ncbi:MAG: hypothetical protein OXC30_03885 [Alphaproteobacteria bacterium]|nr:hypothetical protein [Alphaproteobacteria bacterium]